MNINSEKINTIECRRAAFVEKCCNEYINDLKCFIESRYPLLSADAVSSLKELWIYTINQILLPTIAYNIFVKKNTYNEVSYYDSLFNREYDGIWKELNSLVNIGDVIRHELNSQVNGIKILLSKLYKDIILDGKNYIEQIVFSMGDMHKAGESTCIIELRDKRKLVYKPVQCNTDIAVYRIMSWVNNEIPILPLHIRSIKSMGNYAYIEYLENRREVLKQDEAESFYYRMGKLLAIGSILHIGDGHMENIISDGGHPYWIDLEASFNTPGEMDGERIHPSEVEYTMLLQDINKRKGEWSVISGMQGGTGRIKSWVAAFALNDGSDEFTVRYRKLSNQSINNRLFLGGKIIFPEDYEEYIIQGFRDVAELIIRKKDSLWLLLDEEFSNKETRIREIIRATVFYTIIKCRSRQPSEIINNNYWDYVFKYLSEEDNYILPIKNRFISFIASSEIRDLQKGYVPIFYRDTYSRRLYNSSGECIEDFYNTDVKTYFREFILNLDNSFIENNVEAIRRCLYSTAQFDYEADIRGWIA